MTCLTFVSLLYLGLRADRVFGLRAAVAFQSASQGYSQTAYRHEDPYHVRLGAIGASYSSGGRLSTPHSYDDSISAATSSSIHPRAPPGPRDRGIPVAGYR
ncbi:uncharacterized protein LOC122040129 [Zingiber officinale]|uniref:uncharacterized protein LOC122040129 n=1 Tax=Zingiber officinale TaxID=94328 RepID=UPI001C4B9D81|nr:uncharacterized protein LOC122040129 [Zingiber officinale]